MSPHRGLMLALLLVALLAVRSAGAQDVENSYHLPNKGVLRVLLVYAQEQPGSVCANANCNNFDPNTVLTTSAPKWFDPQSTYPPEGVVTDYYWQASFGEYEVLGDYLPQVLTIPCNGQAGNTFDPTNQAIAMANQLMSQSGFTSANGLHKADFDLWTTTSPGQPKINQPDGKMDAVVIVWRNHRAWGCGAGYGMQAWGSTVNAMSSFNAGGEGFDFLFLEYFHALFGGNNWHTGGGAGAHTFLVIPKMFSTTGQSGSPSHLANAWDRQQMAWKDPARADLLMATDATCTFDEPSDLDITTHPQGGDFCLRDYNLTGDALRIKLPHLDWSPPLQPVKNQYLLIENRRLNKSVTPYNHNFDVYGGLAFGNACEQPGIPGLYAYIQVGKDVKTGSQVYSGALDHPNGLGSFMHPLEAEGRYDYVWRYDKPQAANPAMGCNWGNANIPMDTWNARTLPNPFTGQSDLALYLDSNKDGTLLNDPVQGGLSEMLRAGTVQHNWYNHGDSGDSFRPGYRTRIGLDTNPAPVPLYTYTQQPFNLTTAGKPKPYENRKILLNGVSVQILGEETDGSLRVRVRFDDTILRRDVRWTGDIVLRKDVRDPMNRPGRLELAPGQILDLDQGLSPTQHKGISQFADGSWLFAAPTALTLETGTQTRINNNSQILVRNGSTLYVKSGAQLALFGQGSITVDAGAWLCVEAGANLILNGPATRLRINAGANIGLNPGLGFPAATCQAATAIVKTGTGLIIPSQGCLDPAGANVGPTRVFFPFDDPASSTFVKELKNGANASKLANPVSCPGVANGALCFDGLASFARTLTAPAALNLGTSDFSIAAWVRTNDTTSVRVILDKRVSFPYRGYSLFLYDGKPGLQMADGLGSEYSNWFSDEAIADGLWHHVVVTVDRNQSNGGRFYVDCNPVTVGGLAAFDPRGRQGSLNNTERISIGRRSSGLVFDGPGFWSGALDELSIFGKVLSPAEIQGLCHTSGVGRCQAPF